MMACVGDGHLTIFCLDSSTMESAKSRVVDSVFCETFRRHELARSRGGMLTCKLVKALSSVDVRRVKNS